jgi:hypothetical protein
VSIYREDDINEEIEVWEAYVPLLALFLVFLLFIF